jgi:hypothetical protein
MGRFTSSTSDRRLVGGVRDAKGLLPAMPRPRGHERAMELCRPRSGVANRSTRTQARRVAAVWTVAPSLHRAAVNLPCYGTGSYRQPTKCGVVHLSRPEISQRTGRESAMVKTLNGVAIVLRWLAGLWLVGWALYVTLRKPISPGWEGTLIDLALLLIPAVLLFAASCAATRYQRPADGTPSPRSIGR